MAHFQTFRQYLIPEASGGGSLEIFRTDEEVACLVFDAARGRCAELRILTAEEAEVPAFRDAFDRRAEMAVRLSHPNLLPVVDHGEDEGVLFYAAAFSDGENLESYCGRIREIPAWMAVELGLQMADALTAAATAPGLNPSTQLYDMRLCVGDDGGPLLKLCELRLAESDPVERSAMRAPVREAAEFLNWLLGQKRGRAGRLVRDPGGGYLDKVRAVLAKCLRGGKGAPSSAEAFRAEILKAAAPVLRGAEAREIPAAFLPQRYLEAQTPDRAALFDFLGPGYEPQSDATRQRGAFGDEAYDPESGRDVTIFRFPPGKVLPDQALDPLRQAAGALSPASYPNLLRPLALKDARGFPYLMEEVANGASLAEILARRGALDGPVVAGILRQLGAAFEQAAAARMGEPFLRLDNVFIHLPPPAPQGAGAFAALADGAASAWSDFLVKVRAHATPAALTEVTVALGRAACAPSPCSGVFACSAARWPPTARCAASPNCRPPSAISSANT
ncbi:MAG: hypothetical protein R3F11_23895 [Verrucomicrobiales bacterium]